MWQAGSKQGIASLLSFKNIFNPNSLMVSTYGWLLVFYCPIFRVLREEQWSNDKFWFILERWSVVNIFNFLLITNLDSLVFWVMIFFLLTNYLWWKFRWNINFQKFYLNKEQGIIFFLLTLLETSKIYRKHHLFKRQKLLWIIKMRNANTRTNWCSICLKSYNYIKFNINRLTDCTHGVNLWIFC